MRVIVWNKNLLPGVQDLIRDNVLFDEVVTIESTNESQSDIYNSLDYIDIIITITTNVVSGLAIDFLSQLLDRFKTQKYFKVTSKSLDSRIGFAKLQQVYDEENHFELMIPSDIQFESMVIIKAAYSFIEKEINFLRENRADYGFILFKNESPRVYCYKLKIGYDCSIEFIEKDEGYRRMENSFLEKKEKNEPNSEFV